MMKFTPIFLALLSLQLFSPSPVFADRSLIGEIEIEEEEKKVAPYGQAQKAAISYFEKFARSIKAGSPIQSPNLGKTEIQYLASSYLYCVLKRGSCPFLLDALFETELVNSSEAGKASCPIMLQFWKEWISADMERRVEHNLKVGYLSKFNEFKKYKRPKYIKCKKSIGEIITSGEVDYSKRYAKGTGERKSVFETAVFLRKEIKEKVPNIFSKMRTKS